MRGNGYEGVLIGPGVRSKVALTVFAESVEIVPLVASDGFEDMVGRSWSESLSVPANRAFGDAVGDVPDIFICF